MSFEAFLFQKILMILIDTYDFSRNIVVSKDINLFLVCREDTSSEGLIDTLRRMESCNYIWKWEYMWCCVFAEENTCGANLEWNMGFNFVLELIISSI